MTKYVLLIPILHDSIYPTNYKENYLYIENKSKRSHTIEVENDMFTNRMVKET